jgi:hypothetical protein
MLMMYKKVMESVCNFSQPERAPKLADCRTNGWRTEVISCGIDSAKTSYDQLNQSNNDNFSGLAKIFLFMTEVKLV